MNATVKFNKLCVVFMQDLSDICPELKDQISSMKLAMNMANATSSTTTQSMFRIHVCVPFGVFITIQDDSFMKDVAYDDNNALIEFVKQIWSGLDVVNKNHIWKYLQNLCKLADAGK